MWPTARRVHLIYCPSSKKRRRLSVPPSLGRKRPRSSAPKHAAVHNLCADSVGIKSFLRCSNWPGRPSSGRVSAGVSGPETDFRHSSLMCRFWTGGWVAVAAALSGPTTLRAGEPPSPCVAAIAAAEGTTRIPAAFLSAMGLVESGRTHGGPAAPWPWTISASGVGHFYATKIEAINAAREFQAHGVPSIDVGCLQINLVYHPEAFASLEQAFDPAANAQAAARLLESLFQETRSWPRAAAAYHSRTPALGQAYARKVLDAWAAPDPSAPPSVVRAPVARDPVARDTGARDPVVQDPVMRDPRLPYRAATASPDAGAEQMGGGSLTLTSGGTPGPAARPPIVSPAHTTQPANSAHSTNPVASGRTLALYRAFPVRLAALPRYPATLSATRRTQSERVSPATAPRAPHSVPE